MVILAFLLELLYLFSSLDFVVLFQVLFNTRFWSVSIPDCSTCNRAAGSGKVSFCVWLSLASSGTVTMTEEAEAWQKTLSN